MQIDALGILQPYLAFVLAVEGPGSAKLTVNAAKILKTAKAMYLPGGIEARCAEPELLQLERVSPAAIVQRTAIDGSTVDEPHLTAMDADDARIRLFRIHKVSEATQIP